MTKHVYNIKLTTLRSTKTEDASHPRWTI